MYPIFLFLCQEFERFQMSFWNGCQFAKLPGAASKSSMQCFHCLLRVVWLQREVQTPGVILCPCQQMYLRRRDHALWNASASLNFWQSRWKINVVRWLCFGSGSMELGICAPKSRPRFTSPTRRLHFGFSRCASFIIQVHADGTIFHENSSAWLMCNFERNFLRREFAVAFYFL